MNQQSTVNHSNNHNSSSGCTYRFIDSSLANLSPEIKRDLEIRQQPRQAKVSIINERDRRPIEPPPILQIHWSGCSEEELKKCLQSPFYYVVANLVTEDKPDIPLLPAEKYLSGSPVSSLHRLRDIDNSEGGYFVFGDLAVKKEGKFKLRFSLFEMIEGEVRNCRTLLSDTFTVYIPKHYPGSVEATFLSRTFSDQGVKMRIRKEHRLQSRKRKHDISNDASSITSLSSDNNSQQPIKRVSPKPSRRSTVSSSIPTTSSTGHFGRWQATAPPSTLSKVKQQDQRSTTAIQSRQNTVTPSPQQQHHQTTFAYINTPTSNFIHDHRFENAKIQQLQHTSFPSPESTIYNTTTTSVASRTSTPQFLSPRHTVNEAGTNLTQTLYHHDPYLITPTKVSADQLPKDRSLAQYHTCNDRHTTSTRNRLPSPPMPITNLHLHATGTQNWGTRLPPLKTIMNDDSNTHSFSTPTTTATPLILPPPPALMAKQTYYFQ
ncbi:velvet factor-domain-containing protein [Mycotypha africana]|uniref:velvet factor-domain-containing protein n=1 Tax=Mycotypha africana TaxID=64632 RepID=UPI0023018D98|nr:velvet factor-domain-containing protein [Mycotypha africana]KAI8969981.1 velvet factor-domain-containing protein [Mycotypha africana]